MFAPGVGGAGGSAQLRAPVLPRLIVSVVYIWQQNDRYFYTGKMINNVRKFFAMILSYTGVY